MLQGETPSQDMIDRSYASYMAWQAKRLRAYFPNPFGPDGQ